MLTETSLGLIKHYGLSMSIREFFNRFEVWEIYDMIIFISNENENMRKAQKKKQKKQPEKSSNMMNFIMGD